VANKSVAYFFNSVEAVSDFDMHSKIFFLTFTKASSTAINLLLGGASQRGKNRVCRFYGVLVLDMPCQQKSRIKYRKNRGFFQGKQRGYAYRRLDEPRPRNNKISKKIRALRSAA